MTIESTVTSNRHLGIGGSDAKRLLDGDWHNLYLEKIGEKERDDLSKVFRVQLGSFTEDFHIDWLEMRNNWEIGERNQERVHDDRQWMRVHPDGIIATSQLPVEVKHSNSRATARSKATYYMAQLQHTMEVIQAPSILFSVIAGNDEPEQVWVDRDEDFITKLVEIEESFWWHVENRVPPEIAPTGTLRDMNEKAAVIPIDGLKPYDMSSNNHWATLAVDYTANQEAHALFEQTKKQIKELVPADASQCTGHGVTIKRDKRGALRFS